MSKEQEEKIDNPGDNSDVDTQEEESKEDSEIEALLNSFSEDDEKSEEDNSSDEKKEDEKETGVFKSIGNHKFKTEEDYDKFAKKNYGEVSRLMGENKKLQKQIDDSNDSKNKEDLSEKSLNEDTLYWNFKAREFYKDNPGAKEFKTVMGMFIEKGMANINGEPNLDLAYAKALRSEGKSLPENITNRLQQKTGNNSNVKKNVMKSGGGSSESISDFADGAILGL